jgi:hypothetical protein
MTAPPNIAAICRDQLWHLAQGRRFKPLIRSRPPRSVRKVHLLLRQRYSRNHCFQNRKNPATFDSEAESDENGFQRQTWSIQWLAERSERLLTRPCDRSGRSAGLQKPANGHPQLKAFQSAFSITQHEIRRLLRPAQTARLHRSQTTRREGESCPLPRVQGCRGRCADWRC